MLVQAVLLQSPNGNEIVKVLDEATALDAAREMIAHGVGSAAVRTRAGSIIGIISEREITGAVSVHCDLSAVKVTEIMLSPVPSIEASETVVKALDQITARRFRHLIVTQDGIVCGIVSIGDMVKAHIHEISLENAVLRDMSSIHVLSRS